MPEGLGVEIGGEPRLLPFSEIVAAEAIDRHSCVWVRGRAEPVLRVPENEANSRLLLKLLVRRIPSLETTAPEEGLGRLLFRRDHGWRSVRVWATSTVGFLWFAFGLLVLATEKLGLPRGESVLLGGLVLLAAFLVLCVRVLLRKRVFECFSDGIRLETRTGGERIMRFDEIETFTYSAVWRSAEHGAAYLGTWFTLEFRPRGDASPLTFAYSSTSRDTAVDELRDFVAGRIASRWWRALAEGRSRMWAKHIYFTPDGLEVTGRKKVVPYLDIGESRLSGGTYTQYHIDGSKLYSLSTAAPNFYPGVALLRILSEPPVPAELVDSEDPDARKRT